MSIKPLGAESLRRATDPARFPFETTAGLPEPLDPVGQDRAMRAVHFGAGMAQAGYNIFVTGPVGSGRRSAVGRALRRLAAAMPAAQDVAYVHNFAEPHRPRALRFAPGEGAKFKADMQVFADALKGTMPKLFASEAYGSRRSALEEGFHRTAETAFDELRRDAETQGVALVERGADSFDFVPSRDGLVMPDGEYRRLPKTERDRLADKIRALKGVLDTTMERLDRARLLALEDVRRMDRELGEAQIRVLIAPLLLGFAPHGEAKAHIESVLQDAVAQIDLLQEMTRGEETDRTRRDGNLFSRYGVNLIVDNSGAKSAPVVPLDLPSLTGLVGKIEQMPVLMTVVTDFMFIRAGALHRSNGGFLMINAMDILRHDQAWDALKRALKARRIKIEGAPDIMDRSQAATIQPEPIALDIKVVLFGEPWVYHRLCQVDTEFAGLFKVQADFAVTAARNDENCADLLCTMASIARADGLKPLDAAGAARLLDEASREAGDAEKVSVRLGRLADLMREGDHYAALEQRPLIAAGDITRAVEAKEDRAGRFRALEHELIQRGIIFIDTDGAKAGQVNGLTVATAAGFSFGVPARITAQVSPGDGRVIDIERVAELSGRSHVKGVQILSGYLNGAYAIGRPLSISASVAFEQSYGRIDGDSASAAELIAILSAVGGVPIRQGIALTGSINQHGQMQPIGGANQKIEGFFDVCAARGLEPHQGVIVPAANVVSLMLRDDVVQAARDGRFAVYGVETVDEAIEILTGMKAGQRQRNGSFPRGSFNRMVQNRLIDFARPRVLKPVHLDGWWRF